MKFRDVLGLAVGNLKRRKWRTVLTVLGVFIGTISVVIMLSLGFGLKGSMEKQMNSFGAMNDIIVSYSGSDKSLYITDKKVNEFKALDFVESVSPEILVPITLSQGKWCIDVYLYGIADENFEGIFLKDGTVPDDNSSDMELVIGNQVIYEAYDKNTYEYSYWEKGEVADIDFMNKPVTMETVSNDDISISEDGKVTINAKKKIANISGIVEGDLNDYGTYSYSVYTEMDSLKKYLERHYEGKAIPGQPVDKNDASYNYWIYTTSTIHIASTDDVDEAVQYFRSLGYMVQSNREWMEQSNGIILIAQLVLGGIGVVALLVAAIGITNTISMSIYERRKEIGVMKVLGCDLENIGGMFLSEAAFIGFLGGIFGVIISYGISAIINVIASPMLAKAVEMDLEISYIPIWLPVVAVIFATLIGMLAGYFPSKKATKMSPLVAIRNE